MGQVKQPDNDNPDHLAGAALSSSPPSIGAAVASPRSVYADRLREFTGLTFADQAAFGQRGRWREFFRRQIGPTFDGRIIFEVGCSDAGFLSKIAAGHRQTGFVGLDWKCRALYLGAKHISGLGLRNVALLRGRGQDVLRIFADGEVDEVWVFHPDPCDRANELKNRLIAEPFLVDLHRVLRDQSSTLSLKTDHPGYYQWVLGLFGLPEPEEFALGPDAAARMSASLRVRWCDLMRPQDIPKPSEAIRQCFKVAAHSADYWHDQAILGHTSGRCFAGEVTAFETRFIGKRLPIYYFEMCKKA